VRKDRRRALEDKTLRVNQIVTRILLDQAIDSSPRFSQTSNRCNTGKVAVWKPLEDIKCRILLEARGERAGFWVQHDYFLFRIGASRMLDPDEPSVCRLIDSSAEMVPNSSPACKRKHVPNWTVLLRAG
jgi:hypothetical protein